MSPFVRILFISFSLSLLCLSASAQKKSNDKKDSLPPPVDSTKFSSFKAEHFTPGFIFLQPRENKLDVFQDYHPRHAGLGNIGLAEKPLLFPALPEPGFNRGKEYFDFFGYDNAARRTFFQVQRPYTRVMAVLGQRLEQVMEITHAQNFGKDFNLAFGFSRIRSTGFYLRQQDNNTAVSFTSNYRSPGRRYAMLANLYWKSVEAAENGGIRNASLFELNEQSNRQLIGVNLASAETFVRRRGVWLKQYWSFGPETEAVKKDTTATAKKKMAIQPRWGFYLETGIEDRDFAYRDEDPQSGFYQTIYRDTNETRDSTHLVKVDNAFGWQLYNRFGRKPRLGTKLALRQQFGELKNDTIYTSFSDWMGEGRIEFPIFLTGAFKRAADSSITGYFKAGAEGRYVAAGTHAGDFSANGWIAATKLKKMSVQLLADWTRRAPEWLYMHYSGNHYRWWNDFAQTGLMRAGAEIEVFPWKLKLGALWLNYERPLYFDSLFLPAQLNGNLNAWTVYAEHHLQLGWFNLRSDIRYHGLPDTAVIRLPALVLRHSLYANIELFKKALRLQFGVDVFYSSSYFADGYNPNLAQFYLQDEKKFGDYPFMDAWVSMKIKPVRIFIKMEHANSGLMGYTYYMVPLYPQNDRALKLGFSWVFND